MAARVLQDLAKIGIWLHSISLQAYEDKEKGWSYSELDQREGLVLEWSVQLFRDVPRLFCRGRG
jgi:hypothetical protein